MVLPIIVGKNTILISLGPRLGYACYSFYDYKGICVTISILMAHTFKPFQFLSSKEIFQIINRARQNKDVGTS
jgi:hypothetical protein